MYKKEKRKERKRKAEGDLDQHVDPDMASMMGFSGFGGSKKWCHGVKYRLFISKFGRSMKWCNGHCVSYKLLISGSNRAHNDLISRVLWIQKMIPLQRTNYLYSDFGGSKWLRAIKVKYNLRQNNYYGSHGVLILVAKLYYIN